MNHLTDFLTILQYSILVALFVIFVFYSIITLNVIKNLQSKQKWFLDKYIKPYSRISKSTQLIFLILKGKYKELKDPTLRKKCFILKILYLTVIVFIIIVAFSLFLQNVYIPKIHTM